MKATLERLAAGETLGEDEARSTLSDVLDGRVDEMHVAIAPALLGSGEAVSSGIDLPAPDGEGPEDARSAASGKTSANARWLRKTRAADKP